jgi:hypothetical protein
MSLYKNEMKKRGTKKKLKKEKKGRKTYLISSLYENANLKKGDKKTQNISSLYENENLKQ